VKVGQVNGNMPQDADRRYLPGIYPIRRSRGFVPLPLDFPYSEGKLFATAAELKNTFCLTKAKKAYLSHHIGDLHDFETLQSYKEGIKHFEYLFDIRPDVIAYDLHPAYLSTDYGIGRARNEHLTLIGVQHHRAHIASCMADNRYQDDKPVIGVAFDGTGYGDDGTIWGGEFFLGGYKRLDRVAYLNPFPMPGGDSAIKQPWKLALAMLYACGVEWDETLPPVSYGAHKESIIEDPIRLLENQLQKQVNCIQTSSMGRLFDAVSSLIGVRHLVNYEGQAAIELEAIAADGIDDYYPFAYKTQGNVLIPDPTPLLLDVLKDYKNKVPVSEISAKFHRSISEMVLMVVKSVRNLHHTNIVALSGGVWQNDYLFKLTYKKLIENGFEVLHHRHVPTNDGGISFGQAVIAGASMEA